MTDENDQQTLRDLFRVMNDMRGDMNTRFDDLRSEMNARFEQVDARFDAQDAKIDAGFSDLNGQTQAIREVVDTLASQEDFAELDRKIASVAVDTKATRSDVNSLKAEVSRLKSAVKGAGIPVR